MEFASRHKTSLCLALSAFCVSLPVIIMVSDSFSTVPQNHVGLDYSTISKHLSNDPKPPGLYFLGLGHEFKLFPTTLQTVRYSTAEHDLLHTRTSDGLPLILGVTFQYRYIVSQVYDMYMAYLEDHAKVLFLAATNTINDIATHFTAYQYFDDKRNITAVMQRELDKEFRENYYCEVYALQIRIFELPQDFDAAIQKTITTKLNYTVTQRYIENVKVALQTNLVVANKTAQVTVVLAHGNAARTYITQEAAANTTRISTAAALQAYGRVRDSLSLDNNDAMLEYIWMDQLASTAARNGTQLLVGVDPSTYIAGRG